MSAVFRKRSTGTTECFFCQSVVLPTNPRAFQCPACSCLNIYDASGQITSNDPAMHDETLNYGSFSKRAIPAKNRLPTAYRKSVFCHTCQTNQTLIANLLSNYLPSPSNPNYQQLLDQLPAYTRSVQTRYPPVCKDCQPAVDEEIRKSNLRARSSVFGSWLDQSKSRRTQDRPSTPPNRYESAIWVLQSMLWSASLVFSWTIFIIGAKAGRPPILFNLRFLPPIAFLSLLWNFWDPAWHRVRQAALRGRELRVLGHNARKQYNLLTWINRFAFSCALSYRVIIPRWCFVVGMVWEVSLFALLIDSIQIAPTPVIRLSRSTTPTSRQPSPTAESLDPLQSPPSEALLSTLSLSSTTASNPVFGHVSLPSSDPLAASSSAPPSNSLLASLSDTQPGAKAAEDAEMDWVPSDTTPIDKFNWMKPQRFHPLQQPTGLEALLAGTSLVDETSETNSRGQTKGAARSGGRWWEKRGLGTWKASLFIGIIALLLGVGTAIWRVNPDWSDYWKQLRPVLSHIPFPSYLTTSPPLSQHLSTELSSSMFISSSSPPTPSIPPVV